MGLPSQNTFLYFAYGSNLLAKRIHLQNPSAVRKDIAQLKDYRLDFNTQSKRWGGASATIVPDKGKTVWGAIWELEDQHRESLDRQEGVAQNIYFPLNVEVVTFGGKKCTCRVYQQCNNPRALKSGEEFPESRKPSHVYHQTILRGAIESGLPQEYIEILKAIPHNGNLGEANLNIELGIGPCIK